MVRQRTTSRLEKDASKGRGTRDCPPGYGCQNSPTVDIFRIGTKYLRRLHGLPQTLMKAIPIMAHPVALKIAQIYGHASPCSPSCPSSSYITTLDTAARLCAFCHGDYLDRDEGLVVITFSTAETRAQTPEDLPPCNPRLIHISLLTSLHFSKPLQATRSSRDTKVRTNPFSC